MSPWAVQNWYERETKRKFNYSCSPKGGWWVVTKRSESAYLHEIPTLKAHKSKQKRGKRHMWINWANKLPLANNFLALRCDFFEWLTTESTRASLSLWNNESHRWLPLPRRDNASDSPLCLVAHSSNVVIGWSSFESLRERILAMLRLRNDKQKLISVEACPSSFSFNSIV